MKRLFLMIIFALFPTIVEAHTHLSFSNPTEGQIVTEELTEIVLEFDADIENLSTMKLFKDGFEIPGMQVQIALNKMTATVPSPLENGNYQIQWSIAGADGHPITGDIHFSMQIPSTSVEQVSSAPEATPASNQETDKMIEQTATNSEVTDNNREDAGSESVEASSDSPANTISIVVGLVLILGIGLLLIRRKQRT